MKINLIYVGKKRQRETDRLTLLYAERIEHYASFQMRAIKSEAAAKHYLKAFHVVVDPHGEQLTSTEFAKLLEQAGKEIIFFVGGSNGFSNTFRNNADYLLSLSRMTFPHELARVVLVEQIYRAFTILRNHPYPR